MEMKKKELREVAKEEVRFSLDIETEIKVQKKIQELGLSFEDGINFLLRKVAKPNEVKKNNATTRRRPSEEKKQ